MISSEVEMFRATADRKRRERVRDSAFRPHVAGAHDCLRYCPSESPAIAMLRALLFPENGAGFLDSCPRRSDLLCNFLPSRRLSRFERQSKETAHFPPLPSCSRGPFPIGLGGRGRRRRPVATTRAMEQPESGVGGDQERRRAPMSLPLRRRRWKEEVGERGRGGRPNQSRRRGPGE